MRTVIAIVIAMMFSGCMNFSVDRSQNADLWQPFSLDHKYTLQEDVFLIRLTQEKGANNLALVPSADSRNSAPNGYKRSGYYSAPSNTLAYDNNPSINRPDVEGIIRTGTQIEPFKLDYYYEFSLWYWFTTSRLRYAKLLSGDFKGTVVNIEDLYWNPDKYLKKE